MNILFAHIIHLLTQTFIDDGQVFEILVFILQSSINQSSFAFNVAEELIIFYCVQRVLLQSFRTVENNAFIVSFYGIMLPLLQFSVYLIQLPRKFGHMNINFEISDFPANFE